MADDEDYDRGLEMIEQVYGFSARKWPRNALSERTVGELFGTVWNRPGLSVRDRRLLVLGVCASLGRADLVETHARGALRSGDLTAEQLEEMVIHLAYYVGWPNMTKIHDGVRAALSDP